VIPHLFILAIVLLVVGVLLVGTLIYAMAIVLLRPPRLNDGAAVYLLHRLSPGDLGFNFEQINFQIRDERTSRAMNIAAWWIPCERSAGRCAIIIHGYADAKVGGIAWAPTLHALGFNILAIDLRAHGESDGRDSTAGYWERHDVSQVINQLRAERPAESRTLVLFGVSLGAAVAAATADIRDDVAAVILESPFADYRAAVRRHGELMRLPGRALQNAAIALAERISGAHFDEVRPIDIIPRIKCPVMIIQASADDFVPEEEARRIQSAIASRADSTCWTLPNTGHALGLANHTAEYAQRLKDFLEAALDARAPQRAPV
jgi:pimeloyl-ACP methyl ester carboxylesterase